MANNHVVIGLGRISRTIVNRIFHETTIKGQLLARIRAVPYSYRELNVRWNR